MIAVAVTATVKNLIMTTVAAVNMNVVYHHLNKIVHNAQQRNTPSVPIDHHNPRLNHLQQKLLSQMSQ
jgi:hypothetical protein